MARQDDRATKKVADDWVVGWAIGVRVKVWYVGCGMKSGCEKEIAATTVLTRHGWLAPLFWVGSQIISDELANSPKWCVPAEWESRRRDADGSGRDDRAPQKVAKDLRDCIVI